jgi:hypothetical protein
MKSKQTVGLLILTIILFISCSKVLYKTNGESIYKSGKNLSGKKLLDKSNSQITFIKNCQTCHGSSGTRNKDCNIQWSYLSNPNELAVPYTDSLFFRFLDQDLKSNGQPAITGVHWDMSLQDKKDLLDYLKTLR